MEDLVETPIPNGQRVVKKSAGTPILITSFRPWKAHQGMNTSDVLVQQVRDSLPSNTMALRWLPVNFDLAPIRVISHMVQYRPKVVICCGMAETRKTLTVEQWGTHGQHQLSTPVDLQVLIRQTVHTRISYDAGDFVCNRLYYRVLQHLAGQAEQQTAVLFVHVPLITTANQAVLEFDFLKIVEYLNGIG
ncbi:pyroglutamyl-peptidase I family protein [Leptothoe sp. PORK10 BA2]|uniref:pyroglutamyl-peptidase I family protein n=1 Tax=Leptothoe sp. PORK10 BA2 TaxID=3110254 RepID=UPI002B1EAB81|nr:peptidase C15 [Leptothoe sp. PORK10 BA2]MEA5467086.1 peptidase C15 [Leptothoe sp. PORK10 BA2]